MAQHTRGNRSMGVRATRLLAAVAVLVGSAACSTAPPASPADTSSRSAPAPSPSPTHADAAADLAAAKKSLVTAGDLGKPWVAVKAVNQTGTHGDACPGTPTTDATVKPLAEAGAQFTAGTKPGAAIGVVSVWTYADGKDVDTYRDTLRKVLAACASYVDGNKLHVVLTPVDSSAISKADETWRYTERVYYDAKHTKLAYARHYVITRHGRELSSIQRAFITDKADPNAEDFSTTDKMAQVQLSKLASTFSDN